MIHYRTKTWSYNTKSVNKSQQISVSDNNTSKARDIVKQRKLLEIGDKKY